MNVIEGSNALSFSLASLYWVSKLARLRVKAISKKSKEDDPKAAANPKHPGRQDNQIIRGDIGSYVLLFCPLSLGFISGC